MNHRRLSLFLVLALSLSLLLAACGEKEAAPTAGTEEPLASSGATESADVATQAPKATDTQAPKATDTQAPEPTDTPAPRPTDTQAPKLTETVAPTEETAPAFDAANVKLAENLDSFRSTMDMTVAGKGADGTDVSQTMTMVAEWVKEPPAQHVTIGGDFPGLSEIMQTTGEAAIDIYVVEGTAYMKMGGGWISVPADESTQDLGSTGLVAGQEMLNDLKDAKYEGKETYNGIETRHYSLDENSLDATQFSAGMEVKKASGNVYIAVDGEYVVHMDMVLEGTELDVPISTGDEKLKEGTITIALDVIDVNTEIVITPPEEALASSKAPDDIPVPDNAEELQVMMAMGLISFSSPDGAQVVADYYKAEMPKNGWTETSFNEISGMFTAAFTKDNRTANLMISYDQAASRTSVLITITTQ